jgi:hypothetical protein
VETSGKAVHLGWFVLLKDGGHVIRMKSTDGKFVVVGGAEAKEIRLRMQERADKLVSDLAAAGLFRKGADCHVKVPEGSETTSKSVDLRVSVREKNTEALLEVKWTRRDLSYALAAAKTSLPWLRAACRGGKWASSRKPVQAGAVGVVAVSPGGWSCRVGAVDGSWSLQLPRQSPTIQKSRSGLSGYQARKGRPDKDVGVRCPKSRHPHRSVDRLRSAGDDPFDYGRHLAPGWRPLLRSGGWVFPKSK